MRWLAAIVMLLAPRGVFCWGLEGHRLVVRIAEGLLSATARARVAATLAPDKSLSALASWADEVRPSRMETEPWHYVDIPLHSSGLDLRRDCPEGNCIIGKIIEFRKTWQDRTASPVIRREALLFLVHFMGDLHQPLHCADNGDQGGNEVRVRFLGGDTQLHAVWDHGLFDHLPAEDALFAQLVRAMTAKHVAEWSHGTVEQWAGESFHVAQKAVYGLLPPPAADGIIELGESYLRAAEPVVELQLEKAGARLATILNQSAP